MAGELPGIRRTAFRQVADREIRRFAVLSGARRTGKTTVMLQVIQALLDEGVPPANILYVSFDNPILRLCGFHQVWETYRRFVPHTGVYYAFLDEVQYAEEWSLWVKTLYDTEPQLRVAATGSASPSIERGASDSGARWSRTGTATCCRAVSRSWCAYVTRRAPSRSCGRMWWTRC